MVLRALCALEAVLERGLTQSCGEIAVMFQSDPQPVRAHVTHAQQQVGGVRVQARMGCLGREGLGAEAVSMRFMARCCCGGRGGDAHVGVQGACLLGV